VAEEKRWDDDLTGAAHDVAAAEASPLKVVAGPGTHLRKEVAFKVGARPAAVSAYSVTTIASRFMDELGPTAPKPRRGKDLSG
jgi:hypothetical protein